MRTRLHNSSGFTLAELLITVAIVVILAAIAIPTVISVQKNMHFVELENAATQVAQAAQNQMTAKKVSGTWLGMLDEDGDYGSQKVKGWVASEDSADFYYFTAEQAKENGILPRNSIDDTIWNGDFIIEYNKSTATVYSVYYSDGKSGIFDSASTTGTPAKDYYDRPGSRDRSDLMGADPMVGYYQGTPAGATAAIALENPTIWVDENGYLCIQNPNVKSLNDPTTKLKFTITKDHTTANPVDITFDNLQSVSGLSYTVSSEARSLGESSVVFSNEEITLIERDVATDTFKIDLNELFEVIGRGGLGADFASLAEEFAEKPNIKIDAQVTLTSNSPHVPATATAYQQWPNVAKRIEILVTDSGFLRPDESYPDHIDGSKYTKPEVHLYVYRNSVTELRDTILKTDEEDVRTIEGTSEALANANPASAYQAYTGASITLEEAADPTIAYLQAETGTYNIYNHQIFEIWINTVKVGFLHNNAWEWAQNGQGVSYEYLEGSGVMYDFLDAEGNTLTGVRNSLKIRPTYFEEVCEYLGIPLNEDDGYTVYLRTTSKYSDVNDYVLSNAKAIWQGANSGNGVNTSRRESSAWWVNNAQKMFERHFGTPSSVSSWTSVKEEETGMADFIPSQWRRYYGNGPLRMYYAGTPALGFESSAPSTTIFEKNEYVPENAGFWYFKSQGGTLIADGMVQKPYVEQVDGPSLALVKHDVYGDFMIPYTQDKLFYRLLFYYDGSTSLAENQYYPYEQWNASGWTSPQIIPYTYQNYRIVQFANIAPEPTKKNGYIFTGWTTNSTYNNSEAHLPSSGEDEPIVGDYDRALVMGRVDLHARYVPARVGLAYFEYYDDGDFGFYGYKDSQDSNLDFNTLQGNDSEIVTWGYFVLVPKGSNGETFTPVTSLGSLLQTEVTVTDDEGVVYECYQFTSQSGIKQAGSYGFISNASFTISGSSVSGDRYSFNHNFAKALTVGNSNANSWGVTGNPYIVRHVDQFVGCLSSSIQSTYMSKQFVQEHDIDFSHQSPAYSTTTAFSGKYDGGYYKILGYQLGTHCSSDLTRAGLFYKVIGTSSNRAEISNLTIEEPRDANIIYNRGWFSSDHVKTGFFAGEARYANFALCKVVGADQAGASQTKYCTVSVYHTATFWVDFFSYTGGMVGYVQTCNFADCEVSYLTLRTYKQGTWVGVRNSLGGITGHSTSGTTSIVRTSNTKTLTHHIRYISNKSFDGSWAYYAGLGGLDGSVRKNATLDVPTGGTSAFNTISSSTNDGSSFSAVNSAVGRTGVDTDDS